MNILVLDGNENQALACVRSLSQAGHIVRAASSSAWSKSGTSRYCAESLTHPDPTEDAAGFVRWILGEAQRFPNLLALPMTEQTTLLLSARRDELLAASCRLILPSHGAVLRAFDKAETIRVARDLKIEVPNTSIFPTSALPESIVCSLRFPVVVKPRSSFEANECGNVRATGRPLYARNPSELLSRWAELRRRCSYVLVQEFVPGEGTGYFALLHHGALRAEFAHRRIRDVHPSGSGSSLRESVRPDPRLREAALCILRELKWHGVAMVEFRRRPDGTLVFMEVNGRFWNSLALAIYSGVDFPAMLVEMAEKGDVPAAGDYRTGVRCRWIVGDFRRVLSVWKGPPRGFPGNYPGRFSSLCEFLLPVPGTYHDNFTFSDPLPEFADWLTFLIRCGSAAWKRATVFGGEANAARGYTRP